MIDLRLFISGVVGKDQLSSLAAELFQTELQTILPQLGAFIPGVFDWGRSQIDIL